MVKTKKKESEGKGVDFLILRQEKHALENKFEDGGSSRCRKTIAHSINQTETVKQKHTKQRGTPSQSDRTGCKFASGSSSWHYWVTSLEAVFRFNFNCAESGAPVTPFTNNVRGRRKKRVSNSLTPKRRRRL